MKSELRGRCIKLLLMLLLALPATAQPDRPAPDDRATFSPRAEYQFSRNAKLAGRAEACGDRAGAAGIRSASKRLVPMLAPDNDFQGHMDVFDRRAQLQSKLTSRAAGKRAECERVADDIFDNLHRTRVIATQGAN